MASKPRRSSAKKKTTAVRKRTTRKTTTAKRAAAVVLTVSAGVERDLAAIAARAPELATSALGTVARALAREIDDRKNSATSKSMCAKALQDVLEQLRELAPPEEERDGLDEITARRRARAATR